ncbi:MAG: transposase [Verrucomicrobiota bacterium]
MGRGNQFRGVGGVFHVTHRCHNREFLLKFARDRDAYGSLLREKLKCHDVALLDYCFTSNHVHLLVDTPAREELSHFMQVVAGEFSRAYNLRKDRMNAFWGENYHATAVEDGVYLWRCMVYIELNMVRCGMVKHPSEWRWNGHGEITGKRKRYRLLDLERLSWRLRTDNLTELRQNLEWSLADQIARDQLKREPCWTEALAVGSRRFVEGMQPKVVVRREVLIEELEDNWVLKEVEISYGSKTDSKNACKAPK